MKKTLQFCMIGVLFAFAVAARAVTIDRLSTTGFDSYVPNRDGLLVLGHTANYYLSDGTQWQSGAGSYYVYHATLDHEQVIGSLIFYYLDPPPGDLALNYTDYGSGDHSSQGVLAFDEPLVLVAREGSSSAYLGGNLRIVSNDATSSGDPSFNFFSAPVGSSVPFETVYSLRDGIRWHPGIFNEGFDFNLNGAVDFRPAVPEASSFVWLAFGIALLSIVRRRGKDLSTV